MANSKLNTGSSHQQQEACLVCVMQRLLVSSACVDVQDMLKMMRPRGLLVWRRWTRRTATGSTGRSRAPCLPPQTSLLMPMLQTLQPLAMLHPTSRWCLAAAGIWAACSAGRLVLAPGLLRAAQIQQPLANPASEADQQRYFSQGAAADNAALAAFLLCDREARALLHRSILCRLPRPSLGSWPLHELKTYIRC